MKKILVKTPNWLGDSIMSIPAVKGIKDLFPKTELTVWTKPSLVDLWRLIPEADNIISSVSRKDKFDLGILLTNSFGTALRMFLAGVPERRGYSLNFRRFLLTQPVSIENKGKKLHQIEYFKGIIEGLDYAKVSTLSSVEWVDLIPAIDISLDLRKEAEDILAAYGWNKKDPIIGIHATASYGPAKCWLPERFSRLIEELKNVYNPWILVFGNQNEKDEIENIIKNVKGKGKVLNLAGKINLGHFAGLISLCRIFIANDSGPMHLAGAVGAPVVAIFGSTSPEKTGPRCRNAIVIKKQISCSPCFGRVCPADMECMRLIEVSDIMETVDKLMVEPIISARPLVKKIAVIMKDYDETKGGAERYLVNLLGALKDKCESIDLLVNRVNGIPPEGINVRKVTAFRWSSVLSPLTFNWSVQNFLKKNKYDIVYGLTQIYPALSTTKSNLEARKGWVYRAGGGLEHCWFNIRYPKMWQRLINYLRPRNLVRFYIENKIFSTCKRFITNSQLCKNQILHHYRVSPEDISVVYNGIDKNKFNTDVERLYKVNIRDQLHIPLDSKVVLFISNNWKRKGLRELIESLSIINNDNLWLVIVGRGKVDFHKRIAKKYNINNVIFTGQVKEPEKFYGIGNVFVLPTYYDPFANVCIEALNCGLPVVTTRMNGASEFILDDKNGYIIEDPKDVNELAEKIRKALQLDISRINESVKDLSLDRNVKETLEALANAIGKRMDSSGILINDGYRRYLEEKGWLDFNKIMQEKGGIFYKKNNLRSVVRVDFNGKKFFLKRHFNPPSPKYFRLWLRRMQKPSWAYREWQNVFRLRSIGIKTMEPAAVGELGDKSFIITEALDSFVRLEDLLKSGNLDFQKKRRLIYELACLTKKMHSNNLFHKDFYTGHIFVKEKDSGYDLFLIDVQRLYKHEFFKMRWRIKDIASLNFTCPGRIINNTDKIRFLKYYLSERDLPKYKKFIKTISVKTERISRHTEKLLRRKALHE